MDKGNIPINIYLDMSKAFDILDHRILIAKLRYYGITGTGYLYSDVSVFVTLKPSHSLRSMTPKSVLIP